MVNFLILIAICILFYLLSKSADLIVNSIKKIGAGVRIPMIFLGFILGFLTSLPELSIAVNAATVDLGDLSLGNLLGGIAILFGFVLGSSVLFGRAVKTDGNRDVILPILIYASLPFLFGINGEISLWEGVFLILSYLILMFYLFEKIEKKDIPSENQPVTKQIFFSLIGIVSLVVISNVIIRLTDGLLEAYNTPAFFVGFLLFSIGTNLPEIMIAIRGIKKKTPELSLFGILGSGIANALIIGSIAFIRPIPIENIYSHIALTLSTLILMFFVYSFYQSSKRITKNEGAILVVIYICIVLLQIFFV